MKWPPTSEDHKRVVQGIAEIHREGDIFFGGPGSYEQFLKRHHTLRGAECAASWDKIYEFWAWFKTRHPEEKPSCQN